MRIEDEIKQKKFESDVQRVIVNLAFTYSWMNGKFKEVFKPFGLSMQQYNVLRILRGRYPDTASAGEVKEVMLDKSPDLTRLVDRLVEKGYVDRSVCPENRRKVDLKITKAGLKLVEQVIKAHGQAEPIGEKLTRKDARTLSDLLDKMRESR